jgi:hypothetical protein
VHAGAGVSAALRYVVRALTSAAPNPRRSEFAISRRVVAVTDEHTRADIAFSSAAFIAAAKEAQDLIDDGRYGPALNDVLQHASELLDIINDHMSGLDHAEHVVAFAVAAKMRSSLATLATAVAASELRDASSR